MNIKLSDSVRFIKGVGPEIYEILKNKLTEDQQYLFKDALLQIIALDKIRNENLFDMVPELFKKHLWKIIS